MIEIVVETGTYEGGWNFANRALCDSEHGIETARQLWDESSTGIQGCRRRITFTAHDDETGVEVKKQMERRP